jgi:predicted dehydrogenase
MEAGYYRGQTITVYGTEGAVEMVDAVGTRWRCRDHPEWIPLELDMEKVEGHKSNLWGTFAMLQDVVKCAEEGGEPVCSARNGRAALELCMAIYQSEGLGSRVDLPLREKQSPLKLLLAERGRG